ncbi:hypothetical protein BGZ83_004619 [Gryganskiella cystojenkinii]|nr:hypothetical protein BGZ83_004619 [Gryganskiella cystojenkinii]
MSKGGSFLKKMGVRKNSFNEAAVPDIPTQSQSQQQQQQSDNSDACSIRSHTTQTSTTSSTSNLTKKRSSKKLMNKLVPKFLQTSFSSTATGTLSSAGTSTISTNSPQSSRVTAGGGLTSPVSSTRSSRSGSTCSEGPGLRKASSESVVVVEGPARVALPPSAPSSTKGSSQESLPLLVEEKVKEVEYVSTGTGSTALAVQTQSSPEFLRSLRLDTAGAIGMISRRLSNASGTKSDVPKQEPAAAPTTASATYLKVEVEYEEEAVEESESEDEEEEEDQEDELSKMTERSKQIEDDPPLSPYIIDENCDDDFFLNSVLRKKSVHTLHQAQDNKPQSQQGFSHTSPPHRYQSSSSIMTTSSRTSETTLYSMRSSPTLTEGWSSGESTPSPTSPYTVNGQVYPFPTMSTAKSNSIGLNMKYQTMQQQHRTNNNPLPAPIYAGQDQRRSRLRDAVGEWRRATNASN